MTVCLKEDIAAGFNDGPVTLFESF